MNALVRTFMSNVLHPALTEVAASERLLRDFTVHTYEVEDLYGVDPLHAEMIAIMCEGGSDSSRLDGYALVIEERDPARREPFYAGRYVVAPWFRFVGDAVFVAPLVMFQMKFDGKLHKFAHRYNNAIADHRIADVTRPLVLDHILNSFTFYRMHAFSDTRPW